MNEQYQDALDKIEVGLEGFEKLLALSKGMSKVMSDYDVFEEVKETYDQEDQQIWKDFIKVGLEFVRSHPDASQLEITVKKAVDVEHETVELSQFDNGYVDMGQNEHATTNVEDKDLIKESFVFDENVQLSQVESPRDNQRRTPVVEEKTVVDDNKRKRKKKRKKEKRQERLLKYHEKLVKTSGLPPSRLMKNQKLTSSDWPDVSKSLVSDFEQIGGEIGSESTSPADTLPPAPVTVPAVPEPQRYYQPSAPEFGDGTTSNTYSLPMLCSTSQPSVGGYQGLSQSPGYGVGGVTTVWPDAGPWLGGLCGSPRLSVGSSSSLNQHQLLSPMYQPSVGLYQQSSPIGSPAFCFHCLQYGSVYTISKV